MSTTQASQAAESIHTLKRDHTNILAVIGEVEQEIADLGSWLTQARANEETMLALWEGQSDDGRKWSKNYGKPIFPWEGAADSRERLTDAAVDELTRLQMTAFSMAELSAIGIEATDSESAGRVQTLMRYEVKQRLHAELWEELNFAVQWKETFGYSLLMAGWERRFGTGLETITEQELAMMLAEANLLAMDPAAAQDPAIQQMIVEQSMDVVLQELEARDLLGQAITMLHERYPLLNERRLKQVLKDLRAEGMAEFRCPYEKAGKPTVRALMPGIDVICPWWTGDVKRAPWVAVVERYSEPELKAKVQTEEWDEEFVTAVIANGPGKIVDVGSLLKNLTAEVNRVFSRGAANAYARKIESARGCYEVLRVHLQTVDEDGYPAMQEVVMHPAISGKDAPSKGKVLVGLDRLLDYSMEGGCFVALRREYKSRPLSDSRGVPELTTSEQAQIKTLKDSRMDRTSLATLPPLKVAPRRLAGNNGMMDVKPGSKVPTGTGEVNDWMTPPALDQGNLEMEASIRREVAHHLGLEHADVPPTQGQTHRQYLVTGFLIQCRELLQKVLQLDQQFMSPLQVSRVIGAGSLPFQVSREEIAGQYDILLAFDVRTLDIDYVQKRWQAIKNAFEIDRTGAMQDVAVQRWLLNNVDPSLADIALSDVQAKTQKEVNDEKQAAANLMLGIEMVPPQDANPQVRLETLMQEVQTNPKVSAMYYGDPAFQAAINARLAKWQFDIQQRGANATIGRTGWEPTVKPPTAEEQLMGQVEV